MHVRSDIIKSKNYLQPDEADASTRPLPKCDVPITVNHSLTVGMWNNAPQIQYTHVVYPDCYRCCYCWCRCACYRNNLSACLLLLRCRQTSKHHASIGCTYVNDTLPQRVARHQNLKAVANWLRLLALICQVLLCQVRMFRAEAEHKVISMLQLRHRDLGQPRLPHLPNLGPKSLLTMFHV